MLGVGVGPLTLIPTLSKRQLYKQMHVDALPTHLYIFKQQDSTHSSYFAFCFLFFFYLTIYVQNCSRRMHTDSSIMVKSQMAWVQVLLENSFAIYQLGDRASYLTSACFHFLTYKMRC